MTRPVSVVIPSLADFSLLERALPALESEFTARGLDDEVIVVDDTGENELAEQLKESFADVRVIAQAENQGFAQALTAGVDAARHELIFSMNPDVVVRKGFLDPLVACLAPDVFAVVPRVLLDGDEEKIESWTGVRIQEGMLEIEQPGLQAEKKLDPPRQAVPIAFAVGGTVLFVRSIFQKLGGFDALYHPFYWEDVDLSWQAWSRGWKTLYQPASVVEHHHRGTIGKLVPEDMVRATIEKNRLLFQWKNLDEPERLTGHLAALYRMVVDAYLADLREELVWVNMALDQTDEVLRERRKRLRRKSLASFGEIEGLTREGWEE